MNITRLRRNEYVKSAIIIGLIIAVVLGLFFGLQVALGTAVPVRVVESGSMSLPLNFIHGPPYSLEEFFLTLQHPFDRTLDTGDIIIIQNADPKTLNTNYPNSDIIVYENPTNPTATPIVHRIVAVENINGTLYFQTKGDGNGEKWPAEPSPQQYDSHSLWTTGEGVSQEHVIGKVVMRIPYLGWVTLFLRNNPWGLPIVVALILLLAVLEFIIPLIRGKKGKPKQPPNLRF